MRTLRAWNLFPAWKLAFGAAAKCGSTSLVNLCARENHGELAEWRRRRVYFEEIPHHYRRVAVVRHPLARFKSLYVNIQERPRSKKNFYAALEGREPEQLLDAIKQAGLDYDIHFQPQVSIGVENADTVVRLEEFDNWWRFVNPYGRLGAVHGVGKCNASSTPSEDVELSRETELEILRLYARDLEVWELADGSTIRTHRPATS